jgi:hypothetical protein
MRKFELSKLILNETFHAYELRATSSLEWLMRESILQWRGSLLLNFGLPNQQPSFGHGLQQGCQ